jgi:hypothetical protein
MNHITLNRIALRAALVAAVATFAVGSASAESAAPSYGGVAIGSTDYGTGLKLFLGGKITPIFGWEGQITSFGSEEYRPGYTHSAWAFGGSATARWPLAPSFSAFGKLGVHYLQPHDKGPGVSNPDTSLELGLGGGLLWQFSQTGAMRLELENIGGSNGDFASVGVQFSF